MASAKVALVAGARGIVGSNLVEALLSRGDWSVIGIARTAGSGSSGGYRHLAVDLLDAGQCRDAADACRDVTHLFYAARAGRADPADEAHVNVAMLRNVLEGTLSRATGLMHVSLVHGTKWYGSHLGRYRTPAREDDPRLPQVNFYYDQHDYIVQRQQGHAWRWSTVRPHIVCGISVGYPFNFITSLAAYGSLCRALGKPFDFPGTDACFNSVSQATDAGLLADALIWTAEDPRCDDQDFNIINGDYFRWCNVWPLLAAFFDVPAGGPTGTPIATAMPDADATWSALVRRHALQDLPLGALANWPFLDFLFRAGWDDMSSTVKSRQAGFHAALDTEAVFLGYLRRLRDQRFIP
ncbi:SDR family oxidoreductase [Vineibacter terrae]|uniref:SDR family oxidoreductase n=1 Tax=Vineibacter terrae TaxID=2586908 RepID=A0A5C8PH50_9HYPH|nr:SDR family oxidoreductase [Vineibacter terrae]TXL73158.1 SDR family oxidoreductase [Vineibacter terrae]